MSLVNSVLPMTNAKDSRWLTLEVCREYQRNKCSRSENECKFAHPPPHVEVNNGRVVCCFDSLKNRCNRTEPPCKYLHPPSHLRDQLLQNGRNNLILKNIQMGMLQQALLHQSGLLQLGPYMPLAATAAPNLPQPPYVAGGNSPFLGGASPLPLISPAPGSDPGLLTAASPAAAAAAAVAGLTPVVPNNLAAAAAAVGGQPMKAMQPNGPTTFNLVHPTSASPAAATSMFGPNTVPSSAHASFVAAAAAALQANQVKGLSGPYSGLPPAAKARPSSEGVPGVAGGGVGAGAENGIGAGGGGGAGCPVSVAGGPPASLLAAAAVASMNSQPGAAALQQAMSASFQSHGATPPAAALATMQLPTGQQAYIPAHPGPGDFSPFAANAGHPSALHRF